MAHSGVPMTIDNFKALVARIESQPEYRRPAAFAVGLASFSMAAIDKPGVVGSPTKILDTWFPLVNFGENFGAAAVLASLTGYRNGTKSYYLNQEQIEEGLEHFSPFINDGKQQPNIDVLSNFREFLRSGSRPNVANISVPRLVTVTFIGDLSDKPVDAHDVYLRLHLLSMRKVKPHGQNLDGLFGLLNNVVWTNEGPFDPEQFDAIRLRLRARGLSVQVHGVDKFPRMTDYVVPSGVRIADANRVRLGAHLAEGTTVMPEAFCNFTA
jgi:2,3,4,5-tetrahydropyridine-2-carboxylate N-succinyltransferase